MSCQILLHDGVIADDLRPTLVAGVRRIYADVVGGAADDLPVDIQVVPAGQWFTAGEVPRTSIVWTVVPADLRPGARTQLLGDICDFWCDATGCSPNEIVITAGDRLPLPTTG